MAADGLSTEPLGSAGRQPGPVLPRTAVDGWRELGGALIGRLQRSSLLVFLLACLLPAVYVVLVRLDNATENRFAPLVDLIFGTGSTPFQYRALSLWILRGLISFLEIGPASYRALLVIWEIAWLLALLAVMRAYLRSLRPGILSDGCAFLVLYAYAFVFGPVRSFYYPSDVPSILFFTAGLLALRQERWIPFAVIFALGTLNRETAGFLAIAFAVTQLGRLETRRLLIAVAGLAGLWIAVKLGLAWLYRGNPGPGMIWTDVQSMSPIPQDFASSRLAANLGILATWRGVVVVSSMCGFLWIPVLLLWHRTGDAFVRRVALLSLPFIAGMAVVGNIWEMRIYGELLPMWLGGIAVALGTAREPA
jgi:hypothetical protein